MLLDQLKPKDFDFWTSLQTRWNDMDALGHANHTAFLSYMETARVDTYIQLGFEGINKRMDKSTILANIEITYLTQLIHPSSLKIGHRIIRVGTKSYDLISGTFCNRIIHSYAQRILNWFPLIMKKIRQS